MNDNPNLIPPHTITPALIEKYRQDVGVQPPGGGVELGMFNGTVTMQFAQPIGGLSLTVEQARQLALGLRQWANEAEKSIRVVTGKGKK